jgi:hypothetical protein
MLIFFMAGSSSLNESSSDLSVRVSLGCCSEESDVVATAEVDDDGVTTGLGVTCEDLSCRGVFWECERDVATAERAAERDGEAEPA